MAMEQNLAEDTRTSELMFPALASWDLASLISKSLWYLAVICVAGGSFSLWLIGDNTRRFLVRNLYYVLFGSIVGFHGVFAYFLIQVGIANDDGIAGMMDWPMISFFLGTGVGEASLFRMAILLALIQLGVGGMVWTAVGYAVINVLMGSIVEPKVLGKGLGLSTPVVFLSLVIWGFILGIVGMFLAIPLTIAIKIMLEEKEGTRWLAVLLGTEDEARQMLKQQKEW